MKKYQLSTNANLPIVTNEVEIESTEIESEDLDSMTISEPEDSNTQPRPEHKPAFSESEYYNGTIKDFYCWGQTEDDIEINIILPNPISSTKDFKINVTSKKLQIFDKTANSGIILEGEFYKPCKVDSLLWSFSKGKLQISLGGILYFI